MSSVLVVETSKALSLSHISSYVYTLNPRGEDDLALSYNLILYGVLSYPQANQCPHGAWDSGLRGLACAYKSGRTSSSNSGNPVWRHLQ